MSALDRIREQVTGNPVILYMKGTPQMPQCGFSSRAAQALMECGEEFAYVNVLMDPEIFQDLPKFADWPTFPQLYIRWRVGRRLRHHAGAPRERRASADGARGARRQRLVNR